ncbi:hypothetical protein [Kitasatospora sp. NPDC002040]|uniref:hypothetical protein n=1 Tax=Kitasatospora sp. NPDC002040 TaxID=3154661 RepID=UPI00331EAC8F
MNTVGRESGLQLHYQRASVSQWMAGTQPRPPVPPVIVEALSRLLGRPVTLEQAGLAPDRAVPLPREREDRYAPEPLRALSAVYRPARLPRRLTAEADRPGLRPVPRPGPARFGPEHVACVALMTDQFSRSDHLSGSGAVVDALTGFTIDVALPWLDGSARPALRRAMFTACARLATLGGFLQADHNRHGCAQNWYFLAASLAEESGDPLTLAVVLRALSVQALGLEQFPLALQLAEHATTLATRADHRTLAHLHGQLGLAQAATGERHAALQTIRRAERHLDRATGDSPAVGTYNTAALAHQRAEVRYRLGDGEGALADLRLSVRLRPVSEARARALVLARLGTLHLAEGSLDAACAVWERFLAARTGISSPRIDAAYAAMRLAVIPHRRNPDVTHLLSTAARSV